MLGCHHHTDWIECYLIIQHHHVANNDNTNPTVEANWISINYVLDNDLKQCELRVFLKECPGCSLRPRFGWTVAWVQLTESVQVDRNSMTDCDERVKNICERRVFLRLDNKSRSMQHRRVWSQQTLHHKEMSNDLEPEIDDWKTAANLHRKRVRI